MDYTNAKTHKLRTQWKIMDGGLTIIAGQKDKSPELRLAYRLFGKQEFEKQTPERQREILAWSFSIMAERAKQRAQARGQADRPNRPKPVHFYENKTIEPWLNL